ncbi:hypothetical protein LTR17_023863 [Elasticomyces elasticus]|nr:hypothetical protein LTR17_023863 [Elasticomyces elasticus]
MAPPSNPPSATRICTGRCKSDKPIDQFADNGPGSGSDYVMRCAACRDLVIDSGTGWARPPNAAELAATMPPSNMSSSAGEGLPGDNDDNANIPSQSANHEPDMLEGHGEIDRALTHAGEISGDPAGRVVTGTVTEALEFLLRLLYLLRVSSLLGFIHEGRVYLQLNGTSVCRGFEGAPLDSAASLNYLRELLPLSYADKLDYLASLSEDDLHNTLFMMDGKAASVTVPMSPTTRFHPRLYLKMSDAQFEHAAMLHVSPVDRPGAVALLPKLAHQKSVLRDPMMLYTDRLKDYFDHLPASLQLGKMPDLHGVNLDFWNPHLSDDRELILGKRSAASKIAFDLIRNAVQASDEAKRAGLTCELMDYQPLEGDAKLGKDIGELKYRLAEELPTGGLRVYNLAALFKLGKGYCMRRSVWNPWRTWTLLFLWTKDKRTVFVLPCTVVRKEYWNAEEYTDLAPEVIAQRRFSTDDPEWFDKVYRQVIQPNPCLKRDPAIIPEGSSAETYAAALLGPGTVLEEGAVDGDDQVIESGYFDGTADDIMRANEECAKQGEGVFTSLGKLPGKGTGTFEGRLTVTVCLYFDHYTWREESKTIFTALPGRLPIGSAIIDHGEHVGAVVVKATSFIPERRYPGWAPTRVRGSILWQAKGGLLADGPCLWLFEGFPWSERHVKHSPVLIPSEFLSFDHVFAIWSRLVGSEVTSWIEYCEKMAGLGKKRHEDYETFDLQLCLVGPEGRKLYLQEFVVREGRQMVDGIRSLVRDRQEYGSSQVSWYEYGAPLMSNTQYQIMLPRIMQSVAELWQYRDTAGDDNDDEDELELEAEPEVVNGLADTAGEETGESEEDDGDPEDGLEDESVEEGDEDESDDNEESEGGWDSQASSSEEEAEESSEEESDEDEYDE